MYNKPLDVAVDNAIKQIKDWCNRNHNNAFKFSLCLNSLILTHLKNHLKQCDINQFNNYRSLKSLLRSENMMLHFNTEKISSIQFIPRYTSDELIISKLNKAITNALINNNGITFKIEDKYLNLSSEKIIEKINNFKFN